MSFVISDDLNPPAWFDYRDGARILIRAAEKDFSFDTLEACTEKKVEYKKIGRAGRHERHEYEVTDDRKFGEIMLDFNLVDWEGFTGPDGSEYPCTTENKIHLMYKLPGFYEFVQDCVRTLSEDNSDSQVGAEKN